jgi:peptidoglycan/xylan/chitin deacetylase (PgdA/CDA1 family)
MQIALTFDDGPNLDTTPKVLDILEENGVIASFFLIGEDITPETEGIVRREFDMGCEINNHSKTHRDMTKLSSEEIRAEIAYTSEKVRAITGEPTHFFRPPYIDVDDARYEAVDLPFICGYVPEDYIDTVDTKARISRVLEHAVDGGIILLHDFPGNFQTVEALKVIVPKLKARGFSFVTVSALFASKGVSPQRGVIYSEVH